MSELLPCSGENCVLSSYCQRYTDYEETDGAYMDPPERSGGECEFFEISDSAAAIITEQAKCQRT